jgi:hypothetical protein
MGIAHSADHAMPSAGSWGYIPETGPPYDKATAVPLPYGYNTIQFVPVGFGAVRLPPARAGESLVVANRGGTTAQVHPDGDDTINGAVTGTISNNRSALYVCYATGKWMAFLDV